MKTGTPFNNYNTSEKMDVMAAMDKLANLMVSDHHTDEEHDEAPQQQQQSFRNFNSLGPNNNEPKSFEQVKQEYLNNPNYFESPQQNNYYGGGTGTKRTASKNNSPFSSKRGVKKIQYEDDSDEEENEDDIKRKRPENRGSIVDRLYDLDKDRKERLASMQFQRYKDELSRMKAKPDISLNSKMITDQKRKIPIHERSYVIMKQREENINRMRAELEEQRAQDEVIYPYRPDTNVSRSYAYDRPRTPEEFAAQVYAWQHRKNENLQREQYDALTDELAKLSFRPKINTRSRFLCEKNQYLNEPIEVRLQKSKEVLQEKKKKMQEDSIPTFAPVLNEKSYNLVKKRRENDKSRDRSANNSFIDTSYDNVKRGGKPGASPSGAGRSLTPTYNNRKAPVPHFGGKSPKFNEVNYAPSMDFLLKKLK